MRRGITPVISIIILLLITVSLSGAAWAFLQGFLLPQITKTFLVPQGGAYCSNNEIKVYVVNTGYQSPLLRDDFIVKNLNPDTTGGFDVLPFPPIAPGNTTQVIGYDCGGMCESNVYYSIELGTGSSIQNIPVFCP